jgi:large subunit ribosomal protein L22
VRATSHPSTPHPSPSTPTPTSNHRQIRRVLDVIRGRSYEEAVAMLEYMPYRACEPLLVCLTSAGANGKNGKGVPLSKQYISEAYADAGPVMKRFRPRSQGR